MKGENCRDENNEEEILLDEDEMKRRTTSNLPFKLKKNVESFDEEKFGEEKFNCTCVSMKNFFNEIAFCLFLSVNNADDSSLEFDVLRGVRLRRGEFHREVRISYVDDELSFIYVMLKDGWIAASRMLNDRFQQTLLDREAPIDICKLVTICCMK